MEATAEAFLLLSFPSCSLSVKDYTETSPLDLQCVTVPLPDASGDWDRDVYLVLRLSISETPIDPARVVQRTVTSTTRVYTFNATSAEPDELVLTIPCPPEDNKSSYLHEDLDTFESILEQYAIEFQSFPSPGTQAQTPSIPNFPPPTYVNDQRDLHGHLVMIDEDTGEVVGEVEDRFRIQEDPMMYQQGHKNDPVIIEVPDEGGLREEDANALAAFAKIVPSEEQDWITRSATVVSRAISSGTNFLVTTITTASNYYITRSNPSPHHSSFNLTTPDHGNTKRQTSPLSSRSHSPTPTPPPLPPRALVFLTSDRTRKNLRAVHAVSGQAVKVSAKTVKTIDNMIRRAMGARPQENRLRYNPAPTSSLSIASTSHADLKPPLPPRPNVYTPSPGSGSPYAPPLPPRSFPLSPPQPSTHQHQQQDSITTLPPQPRLTTTRRLLISADLILSTIDDSTRKLLDSGTINLGRVVHHKYGAEAAESSLLVAGTARNIALVYIDMSGMGRRALLRRAGMSFVKGRVQRRKDGKRPVPLIPGQETRK